MLTLHTNYKYNKLWMSQTRRILYGVFGLFIVILIAIITYLFINQTKWNQQQIEKANKKCQEYNEQACKLSDPAPPPNDEPSAIIGGDDAEQGQFPHQALAQFTNSENSSWGMLCGGSLISEYFVLTAAHCITGTGGNPEIKVLLGSLYAEVGIGRVYNVQKFHVYPGYTVKQILHDIALLKLQEKVDFIPTIRPICLNTDYKFEKYQNATASGWGYTSITTNNTSKIVIISFKERISRRLKMVQLRINEDLSSTCNLYLQLTDIDPRYLICTLNPEKVNSAYKGDSGGPLQVWSSGCSNGETTLYEQLGVFSRFEENAKPGRGRFNVFMKVERYVPWIANIVWP